MTNRDVKMSVSVVIGSLNGAMTIGRTLVALHYQDHPGDLEVIVVDDGSVDGTADVARQHGAVVIRHELNRGIGAAREAGWRASSNQFVAFTDDDCEPPPGWISTLLAQLVRDEKVGVVGGGVRAVDTGSLLLRYLDQKTWAPLELDLLESDHPLFRLRHYLRSVAGTDVRVAPRPVASLSGANMLWRRSALEAIGGFDARFTFGGEEEDACHRAVRLGREVVYISGADVGHMFDDRYRDVVRRSVGYGRGNARTWLKRRTGLPTVYPFPVLVAAALGVGVFAARRGGNYWLAAPAFMPAVLFPRNLRRALRATSFEPIAFAYLQLFEEACANVGGFEVLARKCVDQIRQFNVESRIAPRRSVPPSVSRTR